MRNERRKAFVPQIKVEEDDKEQRIATCIQILRKEDCCIAIDSPHLYVCIQQREHWFLALLTRRPIVQILLGIS
jgi:hypothetical protein